jgi:hypothetical protein
MTSKLVVILVLSAALVFGGTNIPPTPLEREDYQLAAASFDKELVDRLDYENDADGEFSLELHGITDYGEDSTIDIIISGEVDYYPEEYNEYPVIYAYLYSYPELEIGSISLTLGSAEYEFQYFGARITLNEAGDKIINGYGIAYGSEPEEYYYAFEFYGFLDENNNFEVIAGLFVSEGYYLDWIVWCDPDDFYGDEDCTKEGKIEALNEYSAFRTSFHANEETGAGSITGLEDIPIPPDNITVQHDGYFHLKKSKSPFEVGENQIIVYIQAEYEYDADTGKVTFEDKESMDAEIAINSYEEFQTLTLTAFSLSQDMQQIVYKGNFGDGMTITGNIFFEDPINFEDEEYPYYDQEKTKMSVTVAKKKISISDTYADLYFN